jgi:hypothetical protein
LETQFKQRGDVFLAESQGNGTLEGLAVLVKDRKETEVSLTRFSLLAKKEMNKKKKKNKTNPKNFFKKKNQIFIAEKDLAWKGKETYFAITDYPKVPTKKPVSEKRSREMIFLSFFFSFSLFDFSTNRLLIIWDASFSFAEIDRNRELYLLEELCKNAEELDLLVFRNTSEPLQHFKKNEVGKMLDYLRTIAYDGGTDLENLAFPAGLERKKKVQNIIDCCLFDCC